MTEQELADSIEKLVIRFFEENPDKTWLSELYTVDVDDTEVEINYDFVRQ